MLDRHFGQHVATHPDDKQPARNRSTPGAVKWCDSARVLISSGVRSETRRNCAEANGEVTPAEQQNVCAAVLQYCYY